MPYLSRGNCAWAMSHPVPPYDLETYSPRELRELWAWIQECLESCYFGYNDPYAMQLTQRIIEDIQVGDMCGGGYYSSFGDMSDSDDEEANNRMLWSSPSEAESNEDLRRPGPRGRGRGRGGRGRGRERGRGSRNAAGSRPGPEPHVCEPQMRAAGEAGLGGTGGIEVEEVEEEEERPRRGRGGGRGGRGGRGGHRPRRPRPATPDSY